MTQAEEFGVRDPPHISIDAFRDEQKYSFPARSQERRPLREDYAGHAASLLDQLAIALGDLPPLGADPRLLIEGMKAGTIVEVITVPPSRVRELKR